MKILVLGASGSEVPRHNTPAFLVDGKILLDAGTVGHTLNIRDEHGIKNILLTHAHFDHIKGIPFLLDNIVLRHTGNRITIMSGKDVLDDLRKNIFNDRIWPDFTKIPDPEHPALVYKALHTSKPVNVEGYTVIMEKVNHPVPAYGFIVENPGKKALAYTGDTGPTDRFWEKMAEHDVKGLIVETSFPNHMEKMALTTGHLTPSLLLKEIGKMRPPLPRIFVMHVKPQYLTDIEIEIDGLGMDNIEFLTEGEIIQI
ncbi:MAG: fold metallo-hydrolase [Actinobacteria bacterium]|nr:fold metallo-hydrolase [Actinomycetota bacterium]